MGTRTKAKRGKTKNLVDADYWPTQSRSLITSRNTNGESATGYESATSRFEGGPKEAGRSQRKGGT